MKIGNSSIVFILFSLLSQVNCENDLYYTSQEAWVYSIVTAFGLGIMSFIMTGILLCIHRKFGGTSKIEPLIQFLIALASGCILGDAFLHLLPHSIILHEDEDEGHEEQHDETHVTEFNMNIYLLCILIGIFFFYVLERISHYHLNEKKQEKSKIIVTPEISVDSKEIKVNINGVDSKQINGNGIVLKEKELSSVPKLQKEKPKLSKDGSDSEIQKKLELEKEFNGKFGDWSNKQAFGFLNLIADIGCNIMDGIALGITFVGADNKAIIQSTILAVYLHELPQEIADAGVLLKARFFPSQVLFCNGVNNFIAVVGVVIGCAIADNVDTTVQRYLLGWVVGLFIYMAAGVLIPIMREERKISNIILQFFGFILGVGVMYAILDFEADDHSEEGHIKEVHEDHH